MRDPSRVRSELERLKDENRSAAVSNIRQLQEAQDADGARAAREDASVEGAGDSELIAARLTLMTRAAHDINRALARLESGDYGICEDCRQSISPRRLQVLPFATKCVACQAAQEERPG